MSSDDYARHIAQKYRLAISLAILNIKPNDLTIDDYIDQIKSIINDKNKVNNMDDDLSISACSDDFKIDSTDDFKERSENGNKTLFNDNRKPLVNDNNTQLNEKSQANANETQISDITQVNDNETQINDKIQVNDYKTYVNVDGRDLNESLTILRNFEEVSKEIDANKERREKLRELIKVLKDDGTTATVKVIHENQQAFPVSLESNPFDLINDDLTQCYDDKYGTLSNSFDVLKSFDNNIEQCSQNFLENSQGDVSKANVRDIEEIQKYPNIAFSQEGKEMRKRMSSDSKFDVSEPKMAKNTQEVDISNATKLVTYENIIKTASNSNLKAFRHKANNQPETATHINIDTQETYLYTADTQFNTHYSESQMNNIVIDDKYIYGCNNARNAKTNVVRNDKDDLFDDQRDKNSIENSTALFQNTQNMNEFPNIASQNLIEIDTALLNNETNKTHERNIANDRTSSQTYIDFDDHTFKPGIDKTQKDCTNFDKTLDSGRIEENLETDLMENNEKIPFKIIEEMNRIKMFLKRKESRIDLSGFKSSQSKSSIAGSQQSLWIGQSANTVFNYLATCSLVTATQELTEQISEVLGQLIDRLHEEETYPPFLEDLLNAVNLTLRLVYEDENYVFDVLLNKDEQMQRLFLLTKSVHIQKFTIEKINKILQKLHDEISGDTVNDIADINKMENLCYIFQILQVLIQKYSANSSKFSSNSQNSSANSESQSSQDRVLRKKDISDLWRKKWIPNFKETKNEGSSQNQCVLKDCSTILNKIIVDSMEEYGLIAFSALKCFNILQS